MHESAVLYNLTVFLDIFFKYKKDQNGTLCLKTLESSLRPSFCKRIGGGLWYRQFLNRFRKNTVLPAVVQCFGQVNTTASVWLSFRLSKSIHETKLMISPCKWQTIMHFLKFHWWSQADIGSGFFFQFWQYVTVIWWYSATHKRDTRYRSC